MISSEMIQTEALEALQNQLRLLVDSDMVQTELETLRNQLRLLADATAHNIHQNSTQQMIQDALLMQQNKTLTYLQKQDEDQRQEFQKFLWDKISRNGNQVKEVNIYRNLHSTPKNWKQCLFTLFAQFISQAATVYM